MLTGILNFLLQQGIAVAVNWGVPYVTAWLKRVAPWLPTGQIGDILQRLIVELKQHKAEHPEKGPEYREKVLGSEAKARKEIEMVCSGVACPPRLKMSQEGESLSR